MEKIDLTTQTLYAELIDRLRLKEAHRSLGDATGTFVTKSIGDRSYLYFQYSIPGGESRQAYIGEKTDALNRIVDKFMSERGEKRAFEESLERLCSQIVQGGATPTTHAVGRVLKAFADAGLFQSGAVIVGTHAFALLGNMLGTRWDNRAIATQDIDIAFPPISLAVPQKMKPVGETLDNLKMGFLPVPPLNPKSASASFQVRGTPLRVDILTTTRAHDPEITFLPRIGSGATALPFLDYILEDSSMAVALSGSGVLLNVPSPARFALHKWIVSLSRNATETAKSNKDMFQSAQMLDLLADEKPDNIRQAAKDITRRGRRWAQLFSAGEKSFEQRHPLVYKKIRRLIDTRT